MEPKFTIKKNLIFNVKQKLHKEKLVDCDDGVSRIYQESSNGVKNTPVQNPDTHSNISTFTRSWPWTLQGALPVMD